MTSLLPACRAVMLPSLLKAVSAPTPAQTFPIKPVTILIGFPAGAPLDAHARLLADKRSAAFKAVLDDPAIKRRMVQQGADPAFLGHEEFSRPLAAELPRWAQAVKTSGAMLD